MPAGSPTVSRRRLGGELRKLREAAGLTIEYVAETLECSSSKISRIENAQVKAAPRDVRDLLEIYGIVGQQRDELLRMARDARQTVWWQRYRDLPSVPLTGLETAASSIRTYLPLLVPGLLQTEDYARAVLRAILFDLPTEEIELRLELRMARQSLLTGDDPPALWVVLDEAVLRRQIGGREVMHAQVERLVDAAALANVTLQVLPYSAGQHAGLDGEFTVISFADRNDTDVVYIEHTTSDLYLEDDDSIQRYSLMFDHLRAAALSPPNSLKFLVQVAEQLTAQ
jgi:transcriptional regulator with XRE-family HTH domain